MNTNQRLPHLLDLDISVQRKRFNCGQISVRELSDGEKLSKVLPYILKNFKV